MVDVQKVALSGKISKKSNRELAPALQRLARSGVIEGGNYVFVSGTKAKEDFPDADIVLYPHNGEPSDAAERHAPENSLKISMTDFLQERISDRQQLADALYELEIKGLKEVINTTGGALRRKQGSRKGRQQGEEEKRGRSRSREIKEERPTRTVPASVTVTSREPSRETKRASASGSRSGSRGRGGARSQERGRSRERGRRSTSRERKASGGGSASREPPQSSSTTPIRRSISRTRTTSPIAGEVSAAPLAAPVRSRSTSQGRRGSTPTTTTIVNVSQSGGSAGDRFWPRKKGARSNQELPGLLEKWVGGRDAARRLGYRFDKNPNAGTNLILLPTGTDCASDYIWKKVAGNAVVRSIGSFLTELERAGVADIFAQAEDSGLILE